MCVIYVYVIYMRVSQIFRNDARKKIVGEYRPKAHVTDQINLEYNNRTHLIWYITTSIICVIRGRKKDRNEERKRGEKGAREREEREESEGRPISYSA